MPTRTSNKCQFCWPNVSGYLFYYRQKLDKFFRAWNLQLGKTYSRKIHSACIVYICNTEFWLLLNIFDKYILQKTLRSRVKWERSIIHPSVEMHEVSDQKGQLWEKCSSIYNLLERKVHPSITVRGPKEEDC